MERSKKPKLVWTAPRRSTRHHGQPSYLVEKDDDTDDASEEEDEDQEEEEQEEKVGTST